MSEMTLINLTPHQICIWRKGEKILTLPSRGVARAYSKEDNLGVLEESSGVNIPLFSTCFGKVTGLPKQKPGVGYVVSRTVAEQARNRFDLFVPGHPVRDGEGVIIGCECLMRL